MAGSVLFDAPGPRARARNRVFNVVTALVVALVIWVVYSQLNAKGQLTAAKWEPFLTANLWKTYILPGVQGTLTAAAVSIVLALTLGFVLGVGRLSTHPARQKWADLGTVVTGDVTKSQAGIAMGRGISGDCNKIPPACLGE